MYTEGGGDPCACNACVDIASIASSGEEEIVRSDTGSDEGGDVCVSDGADDGGMSSFRGSNVGRITLVGGSSASGVTCADGRFGTEWTGEFDTDPVPGFDGGFAVGSDEGRDDWATDCSDN